MSPGSLPSPSLVIHGQAAPSSSKMTPSVSKNFCMAYSARTPASVPTSSTSAGRRAKRPLQTTPAI